MPRAPRVFQLVIFPLNWNMSQPFVSKMVRVKVGGGGETMKALARALAVSEDVLRLS